MGNREYASKEFVEESYLKKDNINNISRDFITLRDKATDCIYYAYIENGIWTSVCRIQTINLVSMPNKTNYIRGEVFDPTGMVLNIVHENGTISVVDDITTSNIPVLGPSTLFQYIEPLSETKHNINIPDLTVEEFDPEVQLIDFEYTINDDGTYTLTKWKGTYKGEESTELIIPNNNLIVV